MAKVAVVTDSTAQLSTAEAQELDITIIPQHVHFGDEVYKEGVDLKPEDFFKRIERGGPMPTASAPTPAEFHSAYQQLHRKTNQILSIHTSGRLSRAVANAGAGAEPLMGRCDFAIIDSMTISVGLGILAKAAARAANAGAPLDEIVRLIRGMLPHIYLVFYVETMDYLERGGRIGRAQAIMGTMLRIKPLLFVEDGEIIPLEKVRTLEKGMEKLHEFVAEFSTLEQAVIVQRSARPTKATRMLLERLKATFPKIEFPMMQYYPVLATHIGPSAIGVAVYEGPTQPEQAPGSSWGTHPASLNLRSTPSPIESALSGRRRATGTAGVIITGYA